MFCSEVANGTSTLQNNIVYKLRPIQFSATFKHEHGGKPNTIISCVVTNLQTSNKRSSNKAITKYFCTNLSRILQIQVISKYIYLHASFLCVLSRAFAYKYIYGHKCAGNFSSPSCILSQLFLYQRLYLTNLIFSKIIVRVNIFDGFIERPLFLSFSAFLISFPFFIC